MFRQRLFSTPERWSEYAFTKMRWLRFFPKKAHVGEYGELHRAVYWAGSPSGGIGVSFVDPIVHYEPEEDALPGYRSFCNGYYKHLPNMQKMMSEILSVGVHSENPLGRMLTPETICPFKDYRELWRPCGVHHDALHERVLLAWYKTSWKCYDYDEDGPCRCITVPEVIPNDFTSRAFNYCYIKKLVADAELRKQIGIFQYFTDDCRISCRYGYWSPAYALALFTSLEKCGVLENAVSSFAQFMSYHPYDPVVASSEEQALKRMSNVVVGIQEQDLLSECIMAAKQTRRNPV